MTFTTQTSAAWVSAAADAIADQRDYLTDLDRRIGDADHGINMNRGFTACRSIDPADYDDPAAYWKKVGMTLVSTVGGASGPLYGTFFLYFSRGLAGDDAAAFLDAFSLGVDGVRARGKAEVGEKTMLDVLVPALEAGRSRVDDGLEVVVEAMASEAERAAAATEDLVATKGRASYLGERSRGTIDPGAASAALVIRAAKEAMAQ